MSTTKLDIPTDAITDAMKAIIEAAPKLDDGKVSPQTLMEVCGVVAAGVFGSTMGGASRKELSLASADIVSAFFAAHRSLEDDQAAPRKLH